MIKRIDIARGADPAIEFKKVADHLMFGFPGLTLTLVDELAGTSTWYWALPGGKDYHGPERMFMDFMKLSLTHNISRFRITTVSMSNVVSEIRIWFAPTEKGDSSGNVTSEFMDVLYDILRMPWELEELHGND